MSRKTTAEDKKEKQQARASRYYENNRTAVLVRMKTRYVDKKDEITGYKMKRSYGITLEEYNALLEQQGGVCAICKCKETLIDRRTGEVRKLAVDHCHESKKVRGLLCRRCNMVLGGVADSIDLLKRMINYLIN
jgi:hypothetical protein